MHACSFWGEKPLCFVCHISSSMNVEFTGLSSGKAGTIAYACIQVVDLSTDFS